MNTTLIKNGVIVTVNRKKEIFIGDILIKNGRIKKLGKKLRNPTNKTIDACGNIVMPGLINGHIHSYATLYKAFGEEKRLFEQKEDKIKPFWDTFNKDYLFTAACATYLECIKNGTCFVHDHYMMNALPDFLIAAMDFTGVSGAISFSWDGKDLDKFVRQCHAKGILPMVYGLPEERLYKKMISSYSKAIQKYIKKGLYVHSHIAECKERKDIMRKRHKTPIVHFLHKHNLLNPQFQLAHAVHISDTEIKLLKKYKVPIINTPVSEMKIADGIAPILQYIKSNLPLGLGTDGAMWNNSSDMFVEMKVLCLLHKLVNGPSCISSYDSLYAATIGGARCFGLENELGSLELGKKANLIILNTDTIKMQPLRMDFRNNVVDNLVYCATGDDVLTTIINGKILMENRTIQYVDEKAVLTSLKAQSASFLRELQHR